MRSVEQNDLYFSTLFDAYRKNDNIQKLYHYFKDKKFLVLFLSTIDGFCPI